MKRLLSRLFAAMGLVSARRHDAALRQLEASRTASLEWKRKAGTATARANALEAELRRLKHDAAKLQMSLDKHRNRHDALRKLRAELADTEHALMVARDQLMAIEAKLDILEGAANVLDVRTRTAVSVLRSGTGATA